MTVDAAIVDALPPSATQTPAAPESASQVDLAALYRFLIGPGYEVDLAAVRARFPEVNWTTFARWVGSTTRISR